MKRIACVVEGRGEVSALPNLVARVLKHLRADEWRVEAHPIRIPRDRLVKPRGSSTNQSFDVGAVDAAVAAARARGADAVLFVYDADDVCAARWCPVALAAVTAHGLPGGVVMIVREYEAWLLARFEAAELRRVGVRDIETVRDAKGRLARLVPGYRPMTHQLQETRKVDVDQARRVLASFDKFVRVIAAITGNDAAKT